MGSDEIFWTSAVRVHGFRDGLEIATTDWFTDVDEQPDWFDISLDNVDRIVVESQADFGNVAGWYGMDNFTFTVVPEPNAVLMFLCAAVTVRHQRRRIGRSEPLCENQTGRGAAGGGTAWRNGDSCGQPAIVAGCDN